LLDTVEVFISHVNFNLLIAYRFKSWIVEQSRHYPDIMKVYLPAILKLITDDDNGKVQQASCSALASLCSEGPEFIEESLHDVIQVILMKNNM